MQGHWIPELVRHAPLLRVPPIVVAHSVTVPGGAHNKPTIAMASRRCGWTRAAGLLLVLLGVGCGRGQQQQHEWPLLVLGVGCGCRHTSWPKKPPWHLWFRSWNPIIRRSTLTCMLPNTSLTACHSPGQQVQVMAAGCPAMHLTLAWYRVPRHAFTFLGTTGA
jgi:hypothetical protein